MNQEQDIEIKTKGDYKNIDLRQLDNGNYIIVTKKDFASGKETKSPYLNQDGTNKVNYLCKVEYKGEDVGFFIRKEEEHKQFEQAGGVGDKVKITFNKEIKTVQTPKGKKDIVVHKTTFESYEFQTC
jgi:hypothetical protein